MPVRRTPVQHHSNAPPAVDHIVQWLWAAARVVLAQQVVVVVVVVLLLDDDVALNQPCHGPRPVVVQLQQRAALAGM